MRKFGNPMGRVPKAGTKGVGRVMLPNRAAVHKLTAKGAQPSITDFANATPSGASAMAAPYPAIMQEGQAGADVEPDV